MEYFENRFEGIIERFRFSLRMYRDDPAHCEQCYQEGLGEMDRIFHRHDCHDGFSKRLMDCRNSYKRRLKKEYLGI
ncbi:TetR family transcriptional regulator [Streptococcus panodentis]|uniref:TetR family transcriptional regulator n=1 Tax=Streptococcus panodentis TaxID=1581472 RepID=A0ABS5AUU0_9STRE|nr:TetR family transcriptional regulator [Streptococcus panodentis]MBP2620342.1 TetR family transcriptional regulator [Streptococcus panodentis]